MEVGTSFFLPAGEKSATALTRRLNSAVTGFRKRTDSTRKFSVLRTAENGVEGVGVWRNE